MKRKIIHTEHAPAAIGPYSQGVSWEELIFSAGQIPLDPATGNLVDGGILDQAERAIENLKAVLEEGGSSLQQVLRLDVYLTDLSYFPDVNQLLAKIFTDSPPARVTIEVGVKGSGEPNDGDAEISILANLLHIYTGSWIKFVGGSSFQDPKSTLQERSGVWNLCSVRSKRRAGSAGSVSAVWSIASLNGTWCA